MVEIVWSNPALDQLDEIAEYISLDKPEAAACLVRDIFSAVERLELFPESGHFPQELPQSVYRELYIKPCRIFYRHEGNHIFIVHIMREERQLRQYLLDLHP
ncbi:MAG: plasmid stabilization protein [Desulfuromonas sp.]|nr:MAG: plasmid stabilization protein [Desulfuromonas sp.]